MGARKIFLLTAIVLSVLLFTRCFQDEQTNDPRGTAYAGSDKCLNCHKSIGESYSHTAHFLSTTIAGASSIAGSFSKDSNTLRIDDSTRIVMEKRDSGFYQVLYVKNREMISRRFDLVMGSVKGQTYLTWNGSGLFQLPISYITALGRWSGSPGYALSDLKFTRTITKDCFECHSAFANRDDQGLVDFRINKNAWVFNIDCERCHGPAAAHVKFHEDNPNEKKATYMISFRTMSRQQKMDVCAVCHSGNNNILLKSRFAFKMGDTLRNYMLPAGGLTQLDVHGNQTQLLSMSKCFKMSSLVCATCHNTHINERGNANKFNETCRSCHSEGNHNCVMATNLNVAMIKNNCTACHMPAQPSIAIRVQKYINNVQSVPTMVVNHRIAIYPEISDKIAKAK